MADVDRGASTVVGYVLNVGIATLLIAGLLFAAGGLVDHQRDRAVRSEFEVVGNRLAADLGTADALLQASDGGTVRIESSVPSHVAGRQYRIQLRSAGSADEIVLRANNPNVTVVVPINTTTDISTGTIQGGDIEITGSGSGPLEVTNG